MAGRNIKLTALDGSPIEDAALSADFRAAEKAGPIWIGRTAFYYRDGLKKHIIPFTEIDQFSIRVESVPTHVDTGVLNVQIYHLILSSGEQELTDIRTENEEHVDRVQALLVERIPNLRIGETQQI
jgi:hypothetical protein